MKRQKICFLALLTLLFACDFQRFTGSDVTSQKLIETSKVYGTISGYYTGDPVSSVSVKVGSQETLSSLNGDYLLNYLISSSEERNKPVQVSIFKTDYYPQDMEIVLSPVENKFNFSIKYAAPIIEKSVRVPDTDEYGQAIHVFQAVIMDYQGIGTVERVWARQLIVDSQGRPDSVFIDLHRVRTISQNRGYYQAVLSGLEYGISNVNTIENSYTLWAEDIEGYRDKETRGMDPRNPDQYIF